MVSYMIAALIWIGVLFVEPGTKFSCQGFVYGGRCCAHGYHMIAAIIWIFALFLALITSVWNAASWKRAFHEADASIADRDDLIVRIVNERDECRKCVAELHNTTDTLRDRYTQQLIERDEAINELKAQVKDLEALRCAGPAGLARPRSPNFRPCAGKAPRTRCGPLFPRGESQC